VFHPAAHLSGEDPSRALDLSFWTENRSAAFWRHLLAQSENPMATRLLRRCTYAGRPFGDEEFLLAMEDRFQRKWRRWAYEAYAAPRA